MGEFTVSDVECGVCGFAGSDKEVSAHVDGEHARVPIFECGKCGFAFWTSDALQNHILGVHIAAGLPATVCLQCCSTFGQSTELDVHLRVIHAPTQPIFCRFCGVLFRGLVALDGHALSVHQGEFLKCPFAECSASFRTTAAVIEHLRRSHKYTPENDKISSVPAESKTADSVSSELVVGNSTSEQLKETNAELNLSEYRGTDHTASTQDSNSDSHANDEVHRGPKRSCLVPTARFVAAAALGDHHSCVVCGLRCSSLPELSSHVNKLHRTFAGPVVSLQEPKSNAAEAADNPENQCTDLPIVKSEELDLANPEGVIAKGKIGKARASITKTRAVKQFRWSTSLTNALTELVLKHGFSDKTFELFHQSYATNRSVGAVKRKAYSLGLQEKPKKKERRERPYRLNRVKEMSGVP